MASVHSYFFIDFGARPSRKRRPASLKHLHNLNKHPYSSGFMPMNTFAASLLILALFPGLAFSQDIKNTAVVSNGFAEKPFENPGGNAPILKLPGNITYLANSIVNADSLNGSITGVAKVLAKGGVAIKRNGKLLNTPVEPLATAYVEAINLADMAFEARQRKSVANLTARQLAHMLVDFGLEVPKGKNETESFMLFLRNWTKAAIAHPDDPTSFAILFIAANNQLQSPRADLTWASQNPDLIRFSRLELELFSAAFERMMVDPNPGFTSQLSNAETGFCGNIKTQLGDWYDPKKVIAKERTNAILKDMLTKLVGSSADKISKGLTSVTLATKVWKFVQMFRYGTISVSLDTPNPRHKPRPSQKDEFGKLTAHAGVDKQTYNDYLKWVENNSGAKAASDINDCLSYMGLPTKTDIIDVAKDAKNWRVSWNIEEGAGDQALWEDGTTFSNWSNQENHLNPLGDTEAVTSIQFQIMPQKADVKTGKEIRRQAVFSAKLKRGGLPEIASNLWGSGKAGYKAADAGFEAFSSAMGLTSVLVDIFGKWALEVASPRSYVTQELFETLPYGWVGTIAVSASKKTSESRYSPGDDSWNRDSYSVQEQALYEVRGSQTAPFSDNIVTGVGAAITRCEIHNNSSQGYGPDLILSQFNTVG